MQTSEEQHSKQSVRKEKNIEEDQKECWQVKIKRREEFSHDRGKSD